MRHIFNFGLCALVLTLTSHLAHADLAVSDSFQVAADGTGAVSLPVANAGAPANGATFDYVARARENLGQTNRRVATFLNFDTSSLTAAEVNDPTFQALFTIDHVGHLNNINPGLDLGVGQNVSGTWDSTTTNPVFAWAAASTNQTTLLQNLQNFPNAESLSVDMTSIVQDWFNTPANNQGLVLFGYQDSGVDEGNLSNASYLTNAVIVTSVAVPEPASGVVVLLGLAGMAIRRRRA